MRQVLALVMTFSAFAANAEVLSAPTSQTMVSIKYGQCTDGVISSGYTKPGHSSSTPGNRQVDGALALFSSKIDCSPNGGTVIGTDKLVALGTVARLEQDVDTLSSFPTQFATKTGELKKGSIIRILSYGGTYGVSVFGGHGDM
ncbi:MAG: hypothetical protein AB7G93_22045 [Bdellovibrionales bacterium]